MLAKLPRAARAHGHVHRKLFSDSASDEVRSGEWMSHDGSQLWSPTYRLSSTVPRWMVPHCSCELTRCWT